MKIFTKILIMQITIKTKKQHEIRERDKRDTETCNKYIEDINRRIEKKSQRRI